MWLRSSSQSDLRRLIRPRYLAIELILVALGATLRFVASGRGHNYDVESYLIVEEIQRQGGNVYAETPRYNYGPAWFLVLRLVGVAADHDPATFRALLVVVLVAVDLAIWAFLRGRFSSTIALLFFLNPIQILICGYHNQFDSLAVLLGLLAVAQLDRREVSRRRFAAAIGLLAASLIVKHLLFVFPVWLALRQQRRVRRAAVLILPPLVFLLAFTPYLSGGGLDGIIRHVFMYESFRNDPLWHALSLGMLPVAWAMPLFVVVLVGCGFLLKRRCPIELLLVYLLVLVAAAPSIANQYLAIVSVPIAVLWSPLFAAFAALGGVFLIGHGDGLNIDAFQPFTALISRRQAPQRAYDLLVLLLAAGTLREVWRPRSERTRRGESPCSRCLGSVGGSRELPATGEPAGSVGRPI